MRQLTLSYIFTENIYFLLWRFKFHMLTQIYYDFIFSYAVIKEASSGYCSEKSPETAHYIFTRPEKYKLAGSLLSL